MAKYTAVESLLLWGCVCYAVVSIEGAGDCPQRCYVSTPEGLPPYVCTQNGTTYNDMLCPTTRSPMGYNPIGLCLYAVDKMGVEYPYQCGCPLACGGWPTSSRGVCMSSGCACNSGWGGDACTIVQCPNSCNGHGTCQSIAGKQTCICSTGYTGQDCGTQVVSLPQVVETVPGERFSDWDEYGLDHPVFNTSVVAQIRITMASSDLDYLLNPINYQSDTYLPCTMWFYNGNLGEVVNNVGIRVLGSTTKAFPKKSWKLSFSTFVSGRKWYQLKHLALKSAVYDPSWVREMASASISYSMNSPVYRTSYGEVFVNDRSWGLYIVSEVMDEQFYKSRMGYSDTPVYKTNLGANFTYWGSDPSDYTNLTCFGGPCYDPETDEASDYTALINFLYVLNNSPDESFESQISKVLDVDSFLRAVIMEISTSNWDGINNECNNIFLFLNSANQFVYWRQDLDLSFGFPDVMDQPVMDYTEINPYKYSPNVLFVRVMNVKSFRDSFTNYFWDLLNKYFMVDGEFFERIETMHVQAAPTAVNDLYHMVSAGYTADDFDVSLYQYVGQIYGVHEYLDARITSLMSQLDDPTTRTSR